MTQNNRAEVSDERPEGHYWTRYGTSIHWYVLYWREGYFWDASDNGYSETSMGDIGPRIYPPGEALSQSQPAPMPVPDWVADFLNRRTEVEHVLRAPMVARKKGQSEPDPLTPEEMWELANKLAVPSEFKPGGGKA